jgi:hypothetical protein
MERNGARDIKRRMSKAVVCYREYRPCAPLRDSVRAFFSFVAPDANDAPRGARMREVLFEAGDSFCSPLFADGHASIVFSFPRACRADGVWHASATAPRAHLIGPMTMVGSSSLEERPEMLGAYLRASAATRITGVSAAELTDRIIPLEDLWGPSACSLAANLSEMNQAAPWPPGIGFIPVDNPCTIFPCKSRHPRPHRLGVPASGSSECATPGGRGWNFTSASYAHLPRDSGRESQAVLSPCPLPCNSTLQASRRPYALGPSRDRDGLRRPIPYDR